MVRGCRGRRPETTCGGGSATFAQHLPLPLLSPSPTVKSTPSLVANDFMKMLDGFSEFVLGKLFGYSVEKSIHDPTWYAAVGSFYTVRFTIRNFFCSVWHAEIFTVAGHGKAPDSNRVPRGVQDQTYIFILPGFQSSSSFSRVNILPL